MQIMNQIRSPVLVHLEINRVKKILKNRKQDDKVLDILENKIHKLGSNTSEASSNKPKLIKDKHNNKKSKIESTKHVLNFNKNVEKKIQGISSPELKISFKKIKGEKNLHYEKHAVNVNMDTFKNMIPLQEIKIFTENNSSNKGGKMLNDASSNSITDSIGLTFDSNSDTYLTSVLQIDDYGIKIEPFFSTTNESSSEIVHQQALVLVKCEPLSESIKLNNSNSAIMDESNICKGSIQTNFSKKISNDSSLNSITDSIGLTFDSNSDTNLSSVARIDDDIKIEPFLCTTNKTSSEIVQQTLITESCESLLESTKLNNTNTTSMNEFNACKELVQTDFSKKMLNDASSNSTINLIDLTLDSSSNTESSSVSHSITSEKFDYTKDEKYVSLKIIVFNNHNYKTYHKQIMFKLAMKLKKNQLLWKFQDARHTPEVNLVKIILEDILKLINHMENKNIIFMGCLSIIFRKTVVSYYNVTDTDLYNHFTLFTDVIEKCLMNINDHFWKTMFPNGWNTFCNGCLIVDLIIHGPSMSMDKYVNWNEIPSTQRFDNNLNIQPCLNKHSVFNNQLEKAPSENSFMPSIFDLPISSNTDTVTPNDTQNVIRKRSIDSLSMPNTLNKSTKKYPQNNDEKLAKRKKKDIPLLPSY